MELPRLTGAAESAYVRYLRKSVQHYLDGEENWRYVMGIIRESGLGKREVHNVLLPLKGYGWKFRSQALFSWLEQP